MGAGLGRTPRARGAKNLPKKAPKDCFQQAKCHPQPIGPTTWAYGLPCAWTLKAGRRHRKTCPKKHQKIAARMAKRRHTPTHHTMCGGGDCAVGHRAAGPGALKSPIFATLSHLPRAVCMGRGRGFDVGTAVRSANGFGSPELTPSTPTDNPCRPAVLTFGGGSGGAVLRSTLEKPVDSTP